MGLELIVSVVKHLKVHPNEAMKNPGHSEKAYECSPQGCIWHAGSVSGLLAILCSPLQVSWLPKLLFERNQN
jgi:hypothetical protein